MESIDYTNTPSSHIEWNVDSWNFRTEIQRQSLLYMSQLEGWFSEKKGFLLTDLVLKTKPEVVVEIGVYGGKTLIPIAYALKMNKKGKIYGVDPWNTSDAIEGVKNEGNFVFWIKVDLDKVKRDLIQKISDFQLQHQIELVEMTALDALSINNIDILLLDGNHVADFAHFEFLKWTSLVKNGGWIIFVDIDGEKDSSIKQKSLDYLDKNYRKIAEFNDFCVWGIWAKP